MTKIVMSDVAVRAGVSLTTVSHVLSGRRPVSAPTRARVMQVIDELGYAPDGPAQSLRTGRTMTAGLIVPDLTNPFYPTVLRGLEDVLRPGGYHVLVANSDGDRAEEIELLRGIQARGVDGLVVSLFGLRREELRPFARQPIVQLAEDFDPEFGDCVRSDGEGGMRAVTRHLLERGRTPLGYAGGPTGVGPSATREAGFRRAHADHGLSVPEELVARADFTRAGGRSCAERLLTRSPGVRGIVCANDLMAIGVLDTAREAGLRVPEDLAVAGFDDIEAAEMVTPQLTTVVNPAREIGRAAGRLLLSRLSGEAGPSREVVLAADLRIREST